MPSIHFPKSRRPYVTHALDVSIPYILHDDSTYDEEVNHYIYKRCIGVVNPSDPGNGNLVATPLGEKAIRQIGYQLLDATSFLMSLSSWTSCGSLTWSNAQSWIFETLYCEAMKSGYWSANFWRSGVPHKLRYRSSIKPRVSEAVRCAEWLSHSGLSCDEVPGISKDDAGQLLSEMLASYRSAERSFVKTGSRPVAYRADPTDGIPPPISEIFEFIERLPTLTDRVAALTLFETGMRGAELEKSLNCPASWGGSPFTGLKHGEIGVLPELASFSNDSTVSVRDCRWKITSKGGKTDYIQATPRLLRVLFQYYHSERATIIRQCRRKYTGSALLLNRIGSKYNYHNLASAMRKTNIRLGRKFRITQHILRHAHACFLLEATMAHMMSQSGIDIKRATSDQIQSFGSLALIGLKADMRHEFFETTQRYLSLLAHGRIVVSFQVAFNSQLDAFFDKS